MIRAEGVSMLYPVPKRYREYLVRPFAQKHITALRNVNLEVHKGACVGLLGPNGAGKTTLLRLLGGLLYPSQGRVTVCGHDTQTDSRLVRAKVGFVLNEERSFYWRLSGIENLEFFGALDDLSGRALRMRIASVLELVGLGRDGQLRVSRYSRGMRQRLAIARGLLSDPEILILDEPTASLDPVGAGGVRSMISAHIGRRRTLVLSTHDLQEAEEICSHICILIRGELAAFRSTKEVKSMPGGLAGYYKLTATSVDVGKC